MEVEDQLDRRPSRPEKSGIWPAPNAATSDGKRTTITVSTRKVVTIAGGMAGKTFLRFR